MASICNDERTTSGVVSGHVGINHRLSDGLPCWPGRGAAQAGCGGSRDHACGPGSAWRHLAGRRIPAPGRQHLSTAADDPFPPHPRTTAPAAAPPAGKYVAGSVLRHVLTMAATGSIGLVALFAVDLLNRFYISLLGQMQLAAAVGYAGRLLFFITSLAIGLSIAVSALVASAAYRAAERQPAGARTALRSTASGWHPGPRPCLAGFAHWAAARSGRPRSRPAASPGAAAAPTWPAGRSPTRPRPGRAGRCR